MTFSYYDVDDDDWREAAVSEGRRAAWLADCVSVSRERDKGVTGDDLRSHFLEAAEHALESFMLYHGHNEIEYRIGVGMLNEAYMRYRFYYLEKENEIIKNYVQHMQGDDDYWDALSEALNAVE